MLHPVTVMVVLVVGVLMVGWTYDAIAAGTTIVSVIEAPELTDGATITSPADGAGFDNAAVTVSGQCPDSSYVKLFVNNGFSGVSWCATDNTWQVAADLFSGDNKLVAQDYNSTDEAGPTTTGITVTYTPPVIVSLTGAEPTASSASNSTTSTTSAPATSDQSSAATDLPLLMTSDFQYQTFAVDNNFSWNFTLKGGTPPYNLLIDWGDGQTSTMYVPTDPVLTIKHQYKAAGYFPVIIHVTDHTGAKETLQLAALIQPKGATGVFNPAAPTTQSGQGITALVSNTQKWLWVAWPAYAVVVLMLVSFWLGETKESQMLLKRVPTKRSGYVRK